MEFTWNEETVQHFKEQFETLPSREFIRLLMNFVENECDLEEGETTDDLYSDLLYEVLN